MKPAPVLNLAHPTHDPGVFNLRQELIVLWGRRPPVFPAALCYRGEQAGHKLYDSKIQYKERLYVSKERLQVLMA